MEKIDKELLRHYLEHGGDAGVRERLREWFLEHDAGIAPVFEVMPEQLLIYFFHRTSGF